MQIPTNASSNLPGRTYLFGIEEIAEAENTHEKRSPVQTAAREELPEKSEILRAHLSTHLLRSEEVRVRLCAEEIARDRILGNKKPLFTSVKRGDNGVPTGIRTPVLTVKG